MTTPLDEEAPDSMVSEDQSIAVFETPDRDFPQYGSITLKLQHGKRQSMSFQMAKRTAESLRDQLNSMLAFPADTVNSVEELDALPVGALILDNIQEVGKVRTNSVYFVDSDEAHTKQLVAELFLPATVIYRPEV